MADPARLLFAGTSVEITPPAGPRMGGYVARGGAGALGAHDALEGVLLSLRDPTGGAARAVWVVLDAIAVDNELAALVASGIGGALGCSPASVLVAATHTHSGPAGWMRNVHPTLGDDADPAMRAELVERLASAAAGLAGQERSVRVVTAEGHAPGVGTNRTDPDGPHDPSVGVLAFVEEEGAVAGCLVDYASHATVLGHDNRLWSADWPGAARHALVRGLTGLRPFEAGGGDGDAPRGGDGSGSARIAAPAPTVAIAQGAAGDASPRFTRRAQSFAEVDRLGALLAAHALEALLGSAPAEVPPGRLGFGRDAVRLATRALPSLAEARRLAAEAEAHWRAVEAAEGAGPRERIARTRHEGADLLVQVVDAGLPGEVELPLSVVAIGDAAWLHLPVELYASFGLAIRAASPFPWTRVVGYTDGYFGYMADEAAHEAGVYEASASLFDASAGDRLVEASLARLRRVRAHAPRGERATVAPAGPPR